MSGDLAGRQVLIWGIGRHGGGVAAARYCAARGARVRLLDRSPIASLGADGRAVQAAGWDHAVGDASHPWFSAADLIVPSPAIAPRLWPERHPPVLSPEALFFREHRGQRLAVTGTKGKSTTARIAGTLLGWDVIGNSYQPALAWLLDQGPDAPVVIELSSFQLWYLRELRPPMSAAILTNLGRDHLDWHPSLEEYHQTKLALLTWSPAAAVHDDLRPRVPASCVRLPPLSCDAGLWASGDLPLLGEHNRTNAALAIAACLHLGLDRSLVAQRLRQVIALPHRLQLVHVGRGIQCVDDSIATTPESAMAGLAAIAGPLAVILGGSDKGARWEDLARAVVARGAHAVVIGTTGPAIADAITQAGGSAMRAADLDAAVSMAAGRLTAGGTLLLSPACASFDMFQGFEHRGACFADSVRRQLT